MLAVLIDWNNTEVFISGLFDKCTEVIGCHLPFVGAGGSATHWLIDILVGGGGRGT